MNMKMQFGKKYKFTRRNLACLLFPMEIQRNIKFAIAIINFIKINIKKEKTSILMHSHNTCINRFLKIRTVAFVHLFQNVDLIIIWYLLSYVHIEFIMTYTEAIFIINVIKNNVRYRRFFVQDFLKIVIDRYIKKKLQYKKQEQYFQIVEDNYKVHRHLIISKDTAPQFQIRNF